MNKDWKFLNKVKNDASGAKRDIKTALRNFFTVDLLPKTMCVLAAICLWFYVMGTDTPIQTRTFREVKIEFIRGDSDLEVLSGERNTVDVVLSGQRSELSGMTGDDIRATVDISGITEAGEYVLDINVSTGNETSVDDRNPKSVYVYLDKSSSRSIKVKADYSGGTSNDKALKIGDLEASKDFVTVYGPEEALSSIAAAEVSVDLQLISNSVNITKAPVKLIDAQGNEIENQYIRIEPATLDVYVPVYMEKTLPVKVQYTYGYFDDQHIKATVSPQQVTVYGEIEEVSHMTSVKTLPVDETTIGRSRTLQTEYDLPEGISVIGDRKCKLTLQINKYAEKQIPVNALSYIGLPDALLAQTTSPVVVTVCGDSEIVSYLSSRDLKLSCDVTSLYEGKHDSVPVSATFVSGELKNVYIKDIGYSASVNITAADKLR